MSDHWTCFAQPKCIDSKCQLVNQSKKPTKEMVRGGEKNFP